MRQERGEGENCKRAESRCRRRLTKGYAKRDNQMLNGEKVRGLGFNTCISAAIEVKKSLFSWSHYRSLPPKSDTEL